jgi:protein-tyrosine phosphatase
MRGFVDLHCHYVPNIDDGSKSREESLAMLRGLHRIGFDVVIATPHMRPGMFDNTRVTLQGAFDQFHASVAGESDLPRLALSSEHYFDDVVFRRLVSGEGVPYPAERAALLEFYEIDFPPMIDHRLFDLKARGILPIIAHPERYQCLWRSPEILERLVEHGAAALLDVAALVGKYGRRPQKCAEDLLERGLYHAACSDAHRPSDIQEVKAGMDRLESMYGPDELKFMFRQGPALLLNGQLPE